MTPPPAHPPMSRAPAPAPAPSAHQGSQSGGCPEACATYCLMPVMGVVLLVLVGACAKFVGDDIRMHLRDRVAPPAQPAEQRHEIELADGSRIATSLATDEQRRAMQPLGQGSVNAQSSHPPTSQRSDSRLQSNACGQRLLADPVTATVLQAISGDPVPGYPIPGYLIGAPSYPTVAAVGSSGVSSGSDNWGG